MCCRFSLPIGNKNLLFALSEPIFQNERHLTGTMMKEKSLVGLWGICDHYDIVLHGLHNTCFYMLSDQVLLSLYKHHKCLNCFSGNHFFLFR